MAASAASASRGAAVASADRPASASASAPFGAPAALSDLLGVPGRGPRLFPQRPPTADSSNRLRDKKRVEEGLGLTETGDSTTIFSDPVEGVAIAKGYNRVVYGDHGPYIEFHPDQVQWDGFPSHVVKGRSAYYDEHFTQNRFVMLYAQKRTVRDKPNPPRGRWACCNDRHSTGYADYQPGRCYVAADAVMVCRLTYACLESLENLERAEVEDNRGADAVPSSVLPRPTHSRPRRGSRCARRRAVPSPSPVSVSSASPDLRLAAGPSRPRSRTPPPRVQPEEEQKQEGQSPQEAKTRSQRPCLPVPLEAPRGAPAAAEAPGPAPRRRLILQQIKHLAAEAARSDKDLQAVPLERKVVEVVEMGEPCFAVDLSEVPPVGVLSPDRGLQLSGELQRRAVAAEALEAVLNGLAGTLPPDLVSQAVCLDWAGGYQERLLGISYEKFLRDHPDSVVLVECPEPFRHLVLPSGPSSLRPDFDVVYWSNQALWCQQERECSPTGELTSVWRRVEETVRDLAAQSGFDLDAYFPEGMGAPDAHFPGGAGAGGADEEEGGACEDGQREESVGVAEEICSDVDWDLEEV